MKLRYIEIDPEVIDELPEWSPAEIQRESEETLKDLGITRRENESYLNAWVQAMLEENGCEDTPENRQRLVAAVRQDRDALLFVWILGGKERKIFGLDDSPQLEWYRAKRAADRALMAAFAQVPSGNIDWERSNRKFSESRLGQFCAGFFNLVIVAAWGWIAYELATTPGGWLPLAIWIALPAGAFGWLIWVALRGE